MKKFDYLVIGGGSGGVGSGRYAAAKFGTKVGIIEHKRLGGTHIYINAQTPPYLNINTENNNSILIINRYDILILK